jgi:phosphoserine phosphatase RsbU/P
MSDKKLLIIDDDEGLVEIFRLFVEKEGYIVEAAYDGLAGLEAVKKFKPDLIVCDLMMPKLDGYGVIAKLAENELSATAKIPVIVVTGFGDPAKEAALRQKPNVVDVMKKPIEYKLLIEKLKTLLAK